MKPSHSALVAAHHATEPQTTGSQDYQDGWKDCYSHILNLWAIFEAYITNLPSPQREACAHLLEACIISLVYNETESEVVIVLPCGDTFAYGCADDEYPTVEDLPLLRHCYTNWGPSGVIAWLAHRRGIEPLLCLQDANYHTAKDYLCKHHS